MRMFSLKIAPKAARESWFDNLDEPDVAKESNALQDAVRSIAQQASKIGREAAEVRGVIDDTVPVCANCIDIVETIKKHGMSLENCVHCRTCEDVCPEVNLRVKPTSQGSGPDFLGL